MKVRVFRLASVYALLAGLTLCAGQGQGPCPAGARTVAFGCMWFSRNRASWTDAKGDCVQRGLQLLTIADERTHRIAVDVVKNDEEMSSWDYYWLGAQEAITDWKWIKDGRMLAWQGCFTIGNHDLEFSRTGFEITPSTCWQLCRDQGKQYAALKARRIRDQRNRVDTLCYCGNNVQSLTVRNTCNVPCDSAEPGGYRYTCGSDTDRSGNENTWLLLRTSGDTSFGRWRNGQPNNHDGNQRCMALTTGNEYKWGDEECFKELRFVCQFDYQTQQECTRVNNRWNDADRACYRLNQTKSTWYKASEACANMDSNVNGYLAKITPNLFTRLKEDFLRIPPLNENPRDWWVGATRSSWEWIDGTPFSFTKFAPLVPDHNGPACLAVSKSSSPENYLWDDKGCEEQFNFVCARLDSRPTRPPPVTTSTTLPPPRTPRPLPTLPPRPQPTPRPRPTEPPITVPPPGPTQPPVPTVRTPRPVEPTVPTVPTSPPASPSSTTSTTVSPPGPTDAPSSGPSAVPSVGPSVGPSVRPSGGPSKTQPRLPPTSPSKTQPQPTRPTLPTRPTRQPRPTKTTRTGIVTPPIDGAAAAGNGNGNSTSQLAGASTVRFTNGMIAAVVVVAVAVVVGLIRLGVYCCQRSSGDED